MHLDGRIEKRVPMAVSVCLISSTDPRTVERVLTENVSSRGARVITKQRWQPGEQQREFLSADQSGRWLVGAVGIEIASPHF